jgi:inosose dehydratase
MVPDAPRTPSRRDFLASGLLAAGALSLGGRSAFARAGDYGPFKMGLQSYSLRHYKTEEALAKTKELGVHYWESYSAHTNPDPTKASEIKSLASASGVEVIGFGVSGFSKDHDKNRKLFEFGKAMGLGYLSADPTPDAFDSLDKLTEEYGIAIGIHPHGPGSRWEKIDQIAAAIKPHSDKIGICLDTGHLLRSKEDPVRAVEVFGKRIYGVHLKDVKGAKTFTILGEGDLDLETLLQKLAQLNYSYCLALEYEENERDPIADIRKCLDATKAAVAKIKV